MYAIYAFCRTADDIADSASEVALSSGAQGALNGISLSVEGSARRALLARYREQLGRMVDGKAEGPVFRELGWAAQRYSLPASLLYELVDGVAADLERSVWPNWSQLERYCQGVAGSVGEMCVRVFGAVCHADRDPEIVAMGRTLGVAMQITNILRDVGEDARRERCYLPTDELAVFGLSPRDILSGELAATDERWRAMMRSQISRARDHYKRAVDGIRYLDQDSQRCASACAMGYARILDAIERSGFDSLTQRAALGWMERTAVLSTCLLGRTASSVAPESAASIPAA